MAVTITDYAIQYEPGGVNIQSLGGKVGMRGREYQRWRYTSTALENFLIVPANPLRIAAIIQASLNNAGDLFVLGFPGLVVLQAGDAFIVNQLLPWTGELLIMNPGGNPNYVDVCEVRIRQ